MERRKFITSTCHFCLLTAAGFFLPAVQGCSPTAYAVIKTEAIGDELHIPLASVNQPALQFVRPKGWLYDIALQKKGDNSYQALLMQCTHQDNQLTPTGNGFACSLHGSQFNKDGKVTKGPAENALKQYLTTINGDHLIIHLTTQK